MLRVRQRRWSRDKKKKKYINHCTRAHWFVSFMCDFYVYAFLLSSVYTYLLHVPSRLTINFIEDSTATKRRFLQHATGLLEYGRIVQQVCKTSFFT